MKKTLMLSVFSAALFLTVTACQDSGSRADSTRHLKPISAQTASALEQKGMTKSSPILVRLYKQESELEVWKETTSGKYALFKTYPICKWSGELGPKVKEGDRQAPEGFYNITPAQMNPKSQYYLAFNVGFPNKFDQSYGRYGSHLMVHGDCSSRGCYAMTDEAIAEIYALARDSFEGGQKGFQLQAMPFRMNAKNFARHRNNPNMAFWKNLKEGTDHFETTKLEPKIEVCERKYVFNAVAPNEALSTPVNMQSKSLDPWSGLKGGKSQTQESQSQLSQSQRVASLPSSDLTPIAPKFDRSNFVATEKCPVYAVNPQFAPLVAQKQAEDNKEIASLISFGIDAAPIKTGLDGGMHPLYAQKMNMPHLDRMANLTTPAAAAPAPPLGTTVIQSPLIPSGQAIVKEEEVKTTNEPKTGLISRLFNKEPKIVGEPTNATAPLPIARPQKLTEQKQGTPLQMVKKKAQ